MQSLFRFYGSSILFVYNGELTPNLTSGSDSSNSPTPSISVKMVDFAHVVKVRDGGKDDEYKFGLHTLIRLFENILKGKPPLEDFT